MGKLFKLREWLTLTEAAKHLSGVFEEAVTDADVLRLVLDGHLAISANFVNGVLARRGKLVLHDEAFPPEREVIPLVQRIENPHEGFQGVALNGDSGFALDLSEQNLTHLSGVIDLSLMGAEIFDLEHRFQQLTGGAEVTLPSPEGVVVCSNGEIFQLQIPPENWENVACKDYHEPMETLPDDAVLVVRTEALRAFEQSVNATPNGSDKPISSNERNSLLTIIAALCDYSGIPHQKRGAASQIAKLTEEIGASVSADTVKRVLEKIQHALDARMK